MGCYIEPFKKKFAGIHLSSERNMIIVAQRFMKDLLINYGKRKASLDGDTWYLPQACKFLKLKHHLQSSFEKSII